LRKVLGDHVVQAGSLVDPDRLRFDFHHFQAMKPEEILQVEDLVNGAVLDDRQVSAEVMDYREAIDRGAMALFGEKYADQVRMVSVEGFSRELCGGTHLERTGQAGLFYLKQESAVAAGIRRIEALTGEGARKYLSAVIDSRNRIAENLRVAPDDLERRIGSLLDEVSALKKRLSSKEGAVTAGILDRGIQQAERAGDTKLVSVEVDAPDVPTLREFADRLREKMDDGIGLLCQNREDKPILIILVTENIIAEKGIKANELAKQIGQEFSLRGGGKPHLSQLGLGSKKEFKKIREYIKKSLGAD
jgi:alanyl-tRNA synthetase